MEDNSSCDQKDGGKKQGWRCRKVLSIWWWKVESVPINDDFSFFFLACEIGVEFISVPEGLSGKKKSLI